ncbi:transposase [Candidatus Enterovibrio altilux]|uniref:transposase n=1 Tax=Candidatus Enterovibrio altilux TaxID=1927128 RepID=UPI00123808F7
MVDEEAIPLWNQMKPGHHGKHHLFSNFAITTTIIVKYVFKISLKDLSRFIHSILNLFNYHCHTLTTHTLASKPRR